LFAKILDGRQIKYGPFLYNRVLRLLPLLLLVVAVVGIRHWSHGGSVLGYLEHVAAGLYAPVLPNGGWSITVEFHFYLVLPLLLFACRRTPWWLVAILIPSMTFRTWLFFSDGTVQWLAYWTIVGRIDQFLLGMIFFQISGIMRGRHVLAVLTAVAFAAFYWWFDSLGGFFQLGAYPSSSPLWIIMPTIEGAAYGALIAYYDRTFEFANDNVWANIVAKVGECSYSLYLLHFFFVFWMAEFIHTHVMAMHSFYVAVAWSIVCFLALVPLAWLSYRFVELPFLKLRVNYLRSSREQALPG